MRSDGELPRLFHHAHRVAQDEDGANRVAFESLMADGEGELHHGLGDLLLKAIGQVERVDGNLLVERLPDAQLEQQVHVPAARPRDGAEHRLLVLQVSGTHARDDGDLCLLERSEFVGRNGDRAKAFGLQAIGDLVRVDRIQQLRLDAATAQIVRGQRHVGDEQQVVHCLARGEAEDGSQELAIEPGVFRHGAAVRKGRMKCRDTPQIPSRL